MNRQARRRLKALYEKMASHTAPVCAACPGTKDDPGPYGCCSSVFCKVASEHAKDVWGVDLEHTGHPILPLMSETGCIAAPHLRPKCSIWVCALGEPSYIGEQLTEIWMERYESLRKEIFAIDPGRLQELSRQAFAILVQEEAEVRMKGLPERVQEQ